MIYRWNKADDSIEEGGPAQWNANDRRVGLDVVGDLRISTVFLCVDHCCGGAPILFETMVFDGDDGCYCSRYATPSEARAGHDRVVALLRGGASIADL